MFCNSFQNQIKKLIAGPVFVKRIRQVRNNVAMVDDVYRTYMHAHVLYFVRLSGLPNPPGSFLPTKPTE